jgi:carboxyl-terminal processing protease
MLRYVVPAAALALVPIATATHAANDADTYRQLDALMDVFERVRAEYVDQVDDKTLIEGAINGMLTSLDPHSSYLNARDFESMRTATDGEYGGLGLTVSMEDGVVKVVSPTDDTPAARAGVKAGDYITHINGELLYGVTLNEAVDKMRGPAGTPIKITVVRQGTPKPMDLSLKREVVQVKPVKWEVKNNIGIIRVSTFNRQTGDATKSAIASIEKAAGTKLAGYVLDLRSNPGGLLDQAIEVSDAFLDRGEIVSQRGRKKGDTQRYYAKPGDLADGKPVIVLVDEGSASAAEIVAGALQDHRRALVLGQQSFGKGSVQTLIPLGPETALRLTTARYFTPAGRSVQMQGIEPDIRVPQLSDADYKDRPRLREADLRHHLVNDVKADDKVLEDDAKPDPRFADTAETLKKKGIDDFQLHYAMGVVGRAGGFQAPVVASAERRTGG